MESWWFSCSVVWLVWCSVELLTILREECSVFIQCENMNKNNMFIYHWLFKTKNYLGCSTGVFNSAELEHYEIYDLSIF